MPSDSTAAASNPANLLVGEDQTYFLRYDRERCEGTYTAVKAALFGKLAQLAVPCVRRYLSDLYHDARWLDANISFDGEVGDAVILKAFAFSLRESGTSLDNNFVGVSYGAERVYQVILLRRGHGRYEVNIWRKS
jgi:hypothetical protein